MGLITGTSTLVYASGSTSTLLTLESKDLGYMVILLMVLVGIGLLDLVRRIFTRR